MPSSLLEFAKHYNVSHKGGDVTFDTTNCIRGTILTFPGYPSSFTEIFFNFEDIHETRAKKLRVTDSNSCIPTRNLHEASHTPSDWLIEFKPLHGAKSLKENEQPAIYVDLDCQLNVAEGIRKQSQRRLRGLPIHVFNNKVNKDDNKIRRMLPINKCCNERKISSKTSADEARASQEQNAVCAVIVPSSRTLYALLTPNLPSVKNIVRNRKDSAECVKKDIEVGCSSKKYYPRGHHSRKEITVEQLHEFTESISSTYLTRNTESLMYGNMRPTDCSEVSKILVDYIEKIPEQDHFQTMKSSLFKIEHVEKHFGIWKENIDISVGKQTQSGSVYELNNAHDSVKTITTISHKIRTTKSCIQNFHFTSSSSDFPHMNPPDEACDSSEAFSDENHDSNNCFYYFSDDKNDSCDDGTTNDESLSDKVNKELFGSNKLLISPAETTQPETEKGHTFSEIAKSHKENVLTCRTINTPLNRLDEKSITMTSTARYKSANRSQCVVNDNDDKFKDVINKKLENEKKITYAEHSNKDGKRCDSKCVNALVRTVISNGVNTKKEHKNIEDGKYSSDSNADRTNDLYTIKAVKLSKLHPLLSKSADNQNGEETINAEKVTDRESKILDIGKIILSESKPCDKVPLLHSPLHTRHDFFKVANSFLAKAKTSLSKARSITLGPILTKIKDILAKDNKLTPHTCHISTVIPDIDHTGIKLKGGICREANISIYNKHSNGTATILEASASTTSRETNSLPSSKKNFQYILRKNTYYVDKSSEFVADGQEGDQNILTLNDNSHTRVYNKNSRFSVIKLNDSTDLEVKQKKRLLPWNKKKKHEQNIHALNNSSLTSAHNKSCLFSITNLNACTDPGVKEKKRLFAWNNKQKHDDTADESLQDNVHGDSNLEQKPCSLSGPTRIKDIQAYAPFATMSRTPVLEPITEVDSVFEEPVTDNVDAEVWKQHEPSLNQASSCIMSDFFSDRSDNEINSTLPSSSSYEDLMNSTDKVLPLCGKVSLIAPTKTQSLVSANDVTNTETGVTAEMPIIVLGVKIERYPSLSDLTHLKEQDYSNHGVLKNELNKETTVLEFLETIDIFDSPSTYTKNKQASNYADYSSTRYENSTFVDINEPPISLLVTEECPSQIQVSLAPEIIYPQTGATFESVNLLPECIDNRLQSIKCNTVLTNMDETLVSCSNLNSMMKRTDVMHNILGSTIGFIQIEDNSSIKPLDCGSRETMSKVKEKNICSPNCEQGNGGKKANCKHYNTCDTLLFDMNSRTTTDCSVHNNNSYIPYLDSRTSADCDVHNSYIPYLDLKTTTDCNVHNSYIPYLNSRSDSQYDTCNSCLSDLDPEGNIHDDQINPSADMFKSDTSSIVPLLNKPDISDRIITPLKIAESKRGLVRSETPLHKTSKTKKSALIDACPTLTTSCDGRRRSPRTKPFVANNTKIGLHVKNNKNIESRTLNPKSCMTSDQFTITFVSTVFGAPHKAHTTTEKSIKDIIASSRTNRNESVIKPVFENAHVSEPDSISTYEARQALDSDNIETNSFDIDICDPKEEVSSQPNHKEDVSRKSDDSIKDREKIDVVLLPKLEERGETNYVDKLTSSPVSGEVVEIYEPDTKTTTQIENFKAERIDTMDSQLEELISSSQIEKPNSRDYFFHIPRYSSKLCASDMFSSRRRNFVSRLTQRIRCSGQAAPKEYNFVNRSMRHLQRCDELIQRSVEIIRRSREMACNAQRQMKYTAEEMNLKSYTAFCD